MSEQPNLVFIFTDEQAPQTMAAYGNQKIETPHMDRLANESMVFENAYVTQPVCTPSRSSLLTGLYPHSNGCTQNNVSLPGSIPCFPELGNFSRYNTAYVGKWHLGDEIFAQHGFSEWYSIDDGYAAHYSEGRDCSSRSTYAQFLVDHGFEPDSTNAHGVGVFSRGFCCRLPEQYTKPAYVANEAVDFIERNQADPFVLFVNFFEPHMPYYGPRDDQYCPEDVELPGNFADWPTEDQPLKTRLFAQAYQERGHSGLPLKTEADWRRMIANYWGLNSLVDTHLGRILAAISACGLDENTIIVYTSDHGDMMGSHRLLAKCVMFEEAARVPLMIKAPGLHEPGQRIAHPISQIDLVPTLLECMHQSVPDHLEGFSWMPYLRGIGPLQEEDVFIEWNGLNNGFGDVVDGVKLRKSWLQMADEEAIVRALGDPVRTIVTPDGWKYNDSLNGESELYNLTSDPLETCNLAADSRQQARISDYRHRISQWQKRTKDQRAFALPSGGVIHS